MYRGLKIIAVIPCLNEERKIGTVVSRVKETGIVDEILVVDDGSTDRSAVVAAEQGAKILKLGSVLGVGAALRHGFEYAKSRSDVIVVLAGNNKDEPKEICRLLDPIVDEDVSLVQGSRYLKGGRFGGDMPFYRKLATRLHPFLMSFLTGHKISDSTNGFRAFKTELLEDHRLNFYQSWLNQYELEPYQLFKTLTAGHKFKEVPVTKIYPPKTLGYTKMAPITGWWSILRPLFLLGLGLRK